MNRRRAFPISIVAAIATVPVSLVPATLSAQAPVGGSTISGPVDSRPKLPDAKIGPIHRHRLPDIRQISNRAIGEWHPFGNGFFLHGDRSQTWSTVDSGDGFGILRTDGLPWQARALDWNADGSLLALSTQLGNHDTVLFAPMELRTDADCPSCISPKGLVAANGRPLPWPKAYHSNDPAKKLGRILEGRFSADGTQFALLDDKGSITIISPASLTQVGRIERRTDPPAAGATALESVPFAFTWGAKNLFAALVARESSPGVRTAVHVYLSLLKDKDGNDPVPLVADARTSAARYSPDGMKLLLVGHDLVIVDRITRATVRTIPVGRRILQAEWRSNGAQIATVTDNDVVQVWDVVTGAQKHTMNGYAAGWSPDGSKLAVGTASGVAILNAATFQVARTLKTTPSGTSTEAVRGPLRWRPTSTGLVAQVGSRLLLWRVD